MIIQRHNPAYRLNQMKKGYRTKFTGFILLCILNKERCNALLTFRLSLLKIRSKKDFLLNATALFVIFILPHDAEGSFPPANSSNNRSD